MSDEDKAAKLRGILYLGRVSNKPPMYKLFGAAGKYGEVGTHRKVSDYRSYIFKNKNKFDVIDGEVVEVKA